MEDFFITLSIIIIVGCVAMVGYSVGQEDPSNYSKFRIVCEYKGGEAQDDVCVLNDKVIDRYEN